MKNLLIIVFSALLLSTAGNAHAAFVIKKTQASTIAIPAAKRHAFLSLPHRHRMSEADKALMWAIGGLIIPPLGIGAVIHADRSLKKEHDQRTRVQISLILGSLEIVETIIGIITIFAVIAILSSAPALAVF